MTREQRSSGDISREINRSSTNAGFELKGSSRNITDEIVGSGVESSSTCESGEANRLPIGKRRSCGCNNICSCVSGYSCERNNRVFDNEAGGLQDCAARSVCAEDGVVN
jgi:hypothetical protein